MSAEITKHPCLGCSDGHVSVWTQLEHAHFDIAVSHLPPTASPACRWVCETYLDEVKDIYRQQIEQITANLQAEVVRMNREAQSIAVGKILEGWFLDESRHWNA